MKNPRTFLSCILGGISIAFVILSTPAFAAGVSDCKPDFPYKDGWMGADNIYSIPLSDSRTLWVFGDTFVRHDNMTGRAGSKMIASSIAISECKAGKWSVTYDWGNKASGPPTPFFAEKDPGAPELWAKDGLVHNGVLYMFFNNVRRTNTGLHFKVIGTTLGRIDNPQDDPAKWNITYQPMTDNGDIFPGVSVTEKDSFLYTFSDLGGNTHHFHPQVLLRIPLDHLNEARNSTEYYAKDGSWKKGMNADDAQIVIPEGNAEMTVRYHPGLNKWVSVEGGAGFPTTTVVARTAPEISGPWSAAKTLYQLPEMNKTGAGYDKDTFCYAVKDHIEFTANEPQKVLVSYACNSFKFNKVVGNMNIYKPRFIELNLSAPAVDQTSK